MSAPSTKDVVKLTRSGSETMVASWLSFQHSQTLLLCGGHFLLQLRGATQAKAAFSPAPSQGAVRPSVRVVGVGAGGLRDRRGCRTAIGDDGNTAVFGLTESYTEHDATDRKLPMQPPSSVTFGGPANENELGFGWQAW